MCSLRHPVFCDAALGRPSARRFALPRIRPLWEFALRPSAGNPAGGKACFADPVEFPADLVYETRAERGLSMAKNESPVQTKTIAVFPGDGVGPEVTREAVRVLEAAVEHAAVRLLFAEGLVGGAAWDRCGDPLPEETLRLARKADAVLFGAVGGPQWDALPFAEKPERALLGLRKALEVFANLRPVTAFDALLDASPIKTAVLRQTDVLIVRELTGDLYFGEPRGIQSDEGQRLGVNTMVYSEGEIRRIARVAFHLARKRKRRLTSVDKANVLECSQLWRDVVTETGGEFPDVALRHMLVDNCAMQLIRDPRQFDVIVTSNLFGDILSDEAAMLTGSIGMLPSASLGERTGLYEPIHGSAPDIAGKDEANPLGAILSGALLLRHSLHLPREARRVEEAVQAVLDRGLRTGDLPQAGTALVGTKAMGAAVAEEVARRAGSAEA